MSAKRRSKGDEPEVRVVPRVTAAMLQSVARPRLGAAGSASELEGGTRMRAQCDDRPVFASRASRAAKAGLWLQARVSLPAGAGISTLRLLRDLRRDGPMAAVERCGRLKGKGLKHPQPAMGNAVKEGWAKLHASHFVLTLHGHEILDLAACVMGEIDAVWQWVETGEGGVPKA